MKIKIVSDGTAPGTRVVNAETGEIIEQIRVVEWWLTAPDRIATAKLELVEIPVDVIGTVQPSAGKDE